MRSPTELLLSTFSLKDRSSLAVSLIHIISPPPLSHVFFSFSGFHFFSVHPSFVFSLNCRHVVFPRIFVSTSDVSSPAPSFFTFLRLFFFLLFTSPSKSFVTLSSQRFPHLAVSSSSILLFLHDFSLCHYIIIFHHVLSCSSSSSHFLAQFHFLLNPPLCPSSPLPCFYGVIRTDFSILCSHQPFPPNPHLSFPIPRLLTHPHSLPSTFINFLHQDFFESLLPPVPSSYLLSHLICPSPCHVVTLSHSHLVTVFTHQSVFIFLSLCHVSFLIFSHPLLVSDFLPSTFSTFIIYLFIFGGVGGDIVFTKCIFQ